MDLTGYGDWGLDRRSTVLAVVAALVAIAASAGFADVSSRVGPPAAPSPAPLHAPRPALTATQLTSGRLVVSYSRAGARLQVADGSTTISLRSIGYARGASLTPLPPAAPLRAGARTVYRRGLATEWYRRRGNALEQGFTIARRPAGAGARSGPLTLAIGLSGALTARAAPGGALLTAEPGGAVLRYDGLHVHDALGRTIRASLAVTGQRRLRLRVWDGGAHYPLTIDPYVQQTTIDLSDHVALSADGNTALIASGSSAQVWVRTGTTWSQQATLTPPSGDEFGGTASLSSDGNTALIGDPGNNATVGAAVVFTRSGSTWSAGVTLTAPTAGSNKEIGAAEFGGAVALSGDGQAAVIGGRYDNAGVGAAWAYTRSGSTWSLSSKLVAPGTVGMASFGASVAMNGVGDDAVIGAPFDQSDTGSAWVFGHSGVGWGTPIELTAPSSGGSREIGAGAFGTAVATDSSGIIDVVGGPADNGGVGAVWVYGLGTLQGKITAPTTGADREIGNAQLGTSLAFAPDDTTVVIGGPSDNTLQGGVWIGTQANGYALHPKLVANSGPEFGASVAVSSGGLTVLAADGPGSSTFVYTNAPAVTNVSPPSGPASGGTPVTITGTDFTNVSGVAFGGTPAASFNVVSSTEIDAVSPPGDAAPVDVTVATSQGTSATGTSDRFTYFASAPGAPSDVHATPGNGSAVVSFDPADANGSSITSYRVTASPGGASATGEGSPITVGGLTNGVTYTFTVTATNGLGTGPTSTPSNAVIPQAPPPTVSHVSITGVAKHKPKLSFTVAAAQGAPGVTSVAVQLPKGLTFSHSKHALRKGAKAKAAKVTVRHGRLTVTFTRSTSKATVTVGRPALSASRSLTARAKRHKAGKGTVAFTVTVQGHTTTKSTAKVKIS